MLHDIVKRLLLVLIVVTFCICKIEGKTKITNDMLLNVYKKLSSEDWNRVRQDKTKSLCRVISNHIFFGIAEKAFNAVSIANIDKENELYSYSYNAFIPTMYYEEKEIFGTNAMIVYYFLSKKLSAFKIIYSSEDRSELNAVKKKMYKYFNDLMTNKSIKYYRSLNNNIDIAVRIDSERDTCYLISGTFKHLSFEVICFPSTLLIHPTINPSLLYFEQCDFSDIKKQFFENFK